MTDDYGYLSTSKGHEAKEGYQTDREDGIPAHLAWPGLDILIKQPLLAFVSIALGIVSLLSDTHLDFPARLVIAFGVTVGFEMIGWLAQIGVTAYQRVHQYPSVRRRALGLIEKLGRERMENKELTQIVEAYVWGKAIAVPRFMIIATRLEVGDVLLILGSPEPPGANLNVGDTLLIADRMTQQRVAMFRAERQTSEGYMEASAIAIWDGLWLTAMRDSAARHSEPETRTIALLVREKENCQSDK